MSTVPPSMIEPLSLPPRRWLRSFRHRGRYRQALLHPDGERLIAAEDDGSITVWRISDGERLWHLPGTLTAVEREESRGLRLALHPDGVRLFVTVIITDCSDVCVCWDLQRGALLARYDDPFTPGAFLPNDQVLTAHGSR
jgi:WD40 repeat protein